MTAEPARPRPFSLIRSAVAAISLANLCLLEVWRQLSSREEYYFARRYEMVDYVGALVALVVLGFLFLALIVAAQKLRPRLLWQLLVALLTLVPLNILRINSSFGLERIKEAATLPVLGVLAGCMALLAPVVWRRRTMLFPSLLTILLVVSPFALVTTSQTVAGVLGSHQSSPREASLVHAAETTAEAPSVVVLLFDELDNRFINPATRPGDLKLPELDRLRTESVVFENAVRAGPETLIAVPSLTTGEIVEKAVPRGFSGLELEQSGRHTRWGDQPNLFDLALAGGFQVHIVGWYQPYCRVFPRVTSCTWLPHSEYFVGQESTLAATVSQYLHSLSPLNRRRLALQTFERIRLEALKRATLANGLVWVHFPIPHLPQVYDRKAGSRTWVGGNSLAGYLDNLVLVDKTISEIRSRMGAAWDRTAVVLVSDHNWRQSKAYDGKSNDRVPLYIKLPAPSPHFVNTSEVASRVLPHVVLGILRGEIRDVNALGSLAESSVRGHLH